MSDPQEQLDTRAIQIASETSGRLEGYSALVSGIREDLAASRTENSDQHRRNADENKAGIAELHARIDIVLAQVVADGKALHKRITNDGKSHRNMFLVAACSALACLAGILGTILTAGLPWQ